MSRSCQPTTTVQPPLPSQLAAPIPNPMSFLPPMPQLVLCTHSPRGAHYPPLSPHSSDPSQRPQDPQGCPGQCGASLFSGMLFSPPEHLRSTTPPNPHTQSCPCPEVTSVSSSPVSHHPQCNFLVLHHPPSSASAPKALNLLGVSSPPTPQLALTFTRPLLTQLT